MTEIRIWQCENGHVLGMVARNGSGVNQLCIYRQAIDLTDEEPAAPEVMAILEGYVFDIRCSVCGTTRTWFPDEAALAEMADTAMLLWQLADQDTDLARQTIGEYLPELLGKIRQMSE